MKLMLRSLLVIVALIVGSATYSQAPVPSPVDIYAHFVGSWVGTDRYVEDGAELNAPVRIQFKEAKKKNRLQMANIYGVKGQKDFSHQNRVITLEPSKAEMILSYEGGSSEKYQATGLDEFAKTGYGRFTATARDMDNGRPVPSRGGFQLEAHNLEYQWEKSINGGPYFVISKFKLTRESSPAAAHSSR